MHQSALQDDFQLKEYTILRLIGEGGFGLTYLAQDTLLNKKVAIKEYFPSEFAVRKEQVTVSPKSSSNQEVFVWGRQSFLKEAQMLAQFDDENIVKVHRFFEANGTAYIVMEYLESGSLSDALRNQETFSQIETQSLLRPLISSLQKVHDKGVLHRDIKPDNIMFRENGAPVLIDFGASRYAVGEKTQTMTTLYTPGFAPVEQYGNTTKTGPWTDIYSMAAVAYRCLTGENPPNVMDRVNKDTIHKMSEVFEPNEFYKSIDKALSLQTDDRPRSLTSWVLGWKTESLKDNSSAEITSFNTQLNTEMPLDSSVNVSKWGSGVLILVIALIFFLGLIYFVTNLNFVAQSDSSSNAISDKLQDKESIAVLPFQRVSQQQDDDFFVNGMHDDLITHLSKIHSLKVIAQGSMSGYANSDKSFQQIVSELNVNHLLTGSVQRGGSRVRINVKLFKPQSNELVWAESYDRELNTSNIFEIQSEIARAITANLKATISNEQLSNVAKAYTDNLQAFDYYLRAKDNGREASLTEMREAIELLRSAIALDPKFKEAWVELAMQLLEYYWFSNGDPQLLVQAQEAVQSAKSIDSDFSELYLAQGLYQYYAHLNYQSAIEFFDQALSQNPGLYEAHFFRGAALRRNGQWQESIQAIKLALELNPRNFFDWLQLEETYNLLGDWANAKLARDQSESLVGENMIVKYHKAMALINLYKDIEGASNLILATQHIENKIPNNLFIEIQTLNRDFDSSIAVAENFTADMEVWRQRITLKEDYLARLYFLQGKNDLAEENAKIALQRLKIMRSKSPDDYRLYLPLARMHAILGNQDLVVDNINDFNSLKPRDEFEWAHQKYHIARIYSLAGMPDMALEQLHKAVTAPTYFHINFARLDPHFIGIVDRLGL